MTTVNVTQNNIPAPRLGSVKFIVTVLAALGIITMMVMWAGLPETPQARLELAGGAAFMLGLTAIFGAVAWHLLLRPLPKGQTVLTGSISARVRVALGALITLTSINLIAGAMWDEVWHRQYGVPLGEDFLWRPHLLMYSFLGLAVVYAFIGFVYIMRTGKGTLQQRFRANPAVALMVIVGAFMMFVVPADPVWHSIYGSDITAWSFPHVMLGISWSAILLLSPMIILTTIPNREWGSVRQYGIKELFAIIPFTAMSNFTIQLLTTDWYSNTNMQHPVLMTRPDWLLPAVLGCGAALIGVVANRSLRRWGTATVVGLLALGMRVLLIGLFGDNDRSLIPTAWIVMLIPMVAIDLVYYLSLRTRKTAPNSIVTGLAIGLAMLLTLPLLNLWIVYPTYELVDVPGVLLFASLLAMGFAWFSEQLGDAMATRFKQVDATADDLGILRYGAPAALVAVIAFIVFYVVTAAPPVLS